MNSKSESKLAKSILESVTNKVPSSIFNTVVNDWLGQFPDLKRYKNGQKMLKQVGPVIIGIELEKFLSDEYRPKFILFNLLDSFNNKLIYVINQYIVDKKGLDISINYNQHKMHYESVSELLKHQSRISLTENPSIEDIIFGIMNYIDNDCLGNPFWSCIAIMQLTKFLNEKSKQEYYFNTATSILKNRVPDEILEMQTKGTEEFINKIKATQTQEFNQSIKNNIIKHKFEDFIKP